MLIEVRNGAAHLGQIDQTIAKRALIPFLRACDELLRAKNRPPSQYWGELYRRVDRLMSESADSARDRARARISDAKKAFANRTKEIGPDGIESLVDGVFARYDIRGYDRDLIDCPACGHKALVTGSYDYEWIVEEDKIDPEGFADEAYPEVTFFPYDLRCYVCGLALNGKAELDAAAIDDAWLVPQEQVDPIDFVPEAEEL